MIRVRCLQGTLVATLMLATAACSSGGDGAVDDDPTFPGSGPTTIDGSEPAASATVAAASSTVAAAETTAVTTTTIEFPSAADELGLVSIEQLTSLDGEGTRPVLEWVPVDGAARYHVIVLTPSGSVYWGWETGDTSLPVGGFPRLDEGAPGPAVSDGMTWSVSAVDDTGHVIALSAHRPISP